ncbi:hypothetical protein SAMN04488074_109302 [Lentzea albidocapillata subsp. violacea]|uniref:Polynucleotide kinase PNKP phosphatase domain-containing protein n=1 Tax=Lentzea albidocapillata subsp. violacea TaxID=128104 RepID=A0A1G9IAC6_9PSEU|nr:hypothetical protein [Lentzea albidocapillata]SDL21783.1 hypothetical protein SAMN04488074_109302 [Lentzea albidocapillata subsp. violacea]
MSRPVAVLDIDGTVADVRHRLHLLDSDSPSKWADFFDAAGDDEVLPQGAELAHKLAADHDIVWLTGRPARIMELTRRWLAEQGLPPGALLMQREGDKRPARVVKLERIQELQYRHTVVMIVDDDPRVVRHLREAGLPVHQATWSPWTPRHGNEDEVAPGGARYLSSFQNGDTGPTPPPSG